MKIKQIEIDCVGYSIAADFYEGSSEKILLNLIGHSSNINKYRDMLEVINRETGMSVLTIDYTGHGRSPFKLIDLMPAQNFLEVVTAFDWIEENNPKAKISVMGASYGGFLATQLTKYRKFDKLILRAPAIYKPNEFYTRWKYFDIESGNKYRDTSEDLDKHPLLKRASKFEGKSFVITHELDVICPTNCTNAFINAFKAVHWEAKGFKHSFSESDVSEDQIKDYYQKIIDWLKK